MTSKPSFMTSYRSLMLRLPIFMTSQRSFMLRRLNKNESIASGWRGIDATFLAAHFIFCANYGKPYSIVKMVL
ncbi:hypothetical protein DOS84_13765 [Flavobacterium aquariorum]|uniref:Uncharacterized protein n=1 Tax=Flavobacterium aquariorum TaxID=2217670 RepID=A0A2W7TRU4_9FLAO|nr:hypothetical protein DOS84_13765 [Flavobacterium aquariorum]